MTDADRIAEFLAKKGATVVASAPAYGVDPVADRARRRAQREADEYNAAEHRAENYQQRMIEEHGYYKS